MRQRMFGLLLTFLALGGLPSPAAAQSASDRPLRVLVGFPAGGAGDLTARMIAEMASAGLGQTAVVENRTGANGMIAAEAVARGPADGSTVLMCPMGTMTISPNLPGLRLPIDVTQELVPVANLALSNYGLVVAAGSAHRNVDDLLRAARARPGALTFASAGIGSAQHLSGEMLKRLAGIDIVHVPYRGAAPALVDLVGGRVDFLITNLADVSGQIRDGAVRLLAVGDEVGHPGFPAPKISASVPGFEISGWFAACAPRAMPREAIAAWARAIRAGQAEPRWRQRLLDNGLTPVEEGPEALAARIERNRTQFRELIQAAGIRAE